MYYTTILMIKNINQISEQAILLDFGDKITKKINLNVINIFYHIINQIKQDNVLDLKNCVPSYNKLLLQFNPAKKNKKEILDFINTIDTTKTESLINNQEIEIPICYDEEFSLDINNISIKTNIQVDKIIESHLSTNFFVYMIGFMPGFPFMGDLKSNLSVPRLITPRLRVPARSVAIVEKFCVIYPNESPGGWNIIGRTPRRLFFKDKKNPCVLYPGTNVKFRSISKKEFSELENII